MIEERTETLATDNLAAPQAKAVARALDILETLDRSRRGMNISEISRKLGIPKSTAHILVLTLEQRGYLEKAQSSRRYSLGLKAYGLGQKLMKYFALGEAALPQMKQLSRKQGLTLHMAVRDKDQALCIEKVEGRGLIQFDTRIGRRMDLHCTALGKVILAFSGADVLEEFLAKKAFMRYTPNTICSPQTLRHETMKTRARGYAVDDEEEEMEVRCVAVPVFDADHVFATALSATGTKGQLPLEDAERIAKEMTKAVQAIFGIKV